MAEAVTSPAPDVTSAVAAESASAAALPAQLVSLDSGPAPAAAAAIDTSARVVLVARARQLGPAAQPRSAFVRTRTMQPGERFVVPERGDLALWTGNAGGIETGGRWPERGAGRRAGATVRNFSLAPDGLKARRRPAH